MLLPEMDMIDKIAARIIGPMSFRFMIQPLTALILGWKDGKMDAEAGMTPFIMDIFFKPEGRKVQLKKAYHSLIKSFVIAVIIDAIAQYLIFQHINPLGALLVGFLLLTIPYSLSRGLTNRIVSRKIKKEGTKT